MTRKPTLSTSRKITNIVLCVIFILFAVIQLNDPDPIVWFSLYIIVALVSIISNYKNIHPYIIWGLVMGYLAYASFHFFYFMDWLQIEHKDELFGEMVYDKPYLEGTREFIGLIMAAGALLFQVKKKS
tara:strand:- start:75 stop:458 length:384 start_codon:yes stop_codon:yes gene_type:complete